MENIEQPYLCWFDTKEQKWVANIKKDKLIKTLNKDKKLYMHTTKKRRKKYYIYNNGQFSPLTKKYPSSSS